MKISKLLVVGLIGLLMAGGLVLAGCKDEAGGCKGDGACYYIVHNNDYKWCGVESCAVWKSTDTGQSSLSCNCK
jgi:hypothetical protein